MEAKKTTVADRPVTKPLISVFGSSVGAEELQEIQTSIDQQWLGIGPKTKAFEEAFTRRRGLRDFALLDSGSNSLYVAIQLLGLPRGAEIILPSFTWIACAHAVVLAGCRPVFCDVDLATQNVTRETIEPHLSAKTGAIMVVHYAGKPVDMPPIVDLGIPVIEDAAHAVDSALDGQACGSMGTVGIFSFDSVKNLAMGEGGGVTAKDSSLVAKARLLRYCGIGKSGFEASAQKARWWEYDIAEFCPKFLPNDIVASIGLAQLRKLDHLQAKRKTLWDYYQKNLSGLSWLRTPEEPGSRERHSYFTYFVRILNGRRDALAKYLFDRRIYTTLRFHPLHLNPIYKAESQHLPVSLTLNEQGLNLPLHPRVTLEDLQRVVEDIRAFAASAG